MATNNHITVQPSLAQVREIVAQSRQLVNPPNRIPVCSSISSDFLTPSAIYLKIAAASSSPHSFLFESAATTETIGRYSFVGANPRDILLSGPEFGLAADPLPRLQAELARYRVAHVPSLRLPPLTGGAIGYVGYDCVRYFEPKTAAPLKDVLHVPESLFMLFDTIVAVDHFFQKVQVITYLSIPEYGSTSTPATEGALSTAYAACRATLASTLHTLQSKATPLPPQPPIPSTAPPFTSNIGQHGYEAHVTTLKQHIIAGDIIQAVPSQRVARPTALHPFNLYRHLRTVNPSPYLFYLSTAHFAIIGASPETLIKADPVTHRIITHPIAGTVPRGSSPAEDALLAESLQNSLKDRAEHVMLVDLARNDINRVCHPLTTRVDKLMQVQKFSHVQHLVSEVSGLLRPGKTRFDAFRSVFPAGTVSGAPKVRAMQLIAKLEGEKRGVYAGAVGYWGYPGVEVETHSPPVAGQTAFTASSDTAVPSTEEDKTTHQINGSSQPYSLLPREGKMQAVEIEGAMDTCIALRTMVMKDGVAYLQAGGGIVFDSVEQEEWEETLRKLEANFRGIEGAEERVREEQGAFGGNGVDGGEGMWAVDEGLDLKGKRNGHLGREEGVRIEI